jgi:transcription initiation factor TFIID TATA-box-binding protein
MEEPAPAAPPPEPAPHDPVAPETCVDVITISNVVVTCSFNCIINLEELAWKYNGEYSPSSFAAVQLRLPVPQTTSLFFSTGKLVVTGARSESAALTAVQILYHLLRTLHPEARVTDVSVQNIVSSSAFPGAVNIDAMSKKLLVSSLYTPDLFPGLRLKLNDPKMKVLLFLKGRVVLTGGRTRSDIERAWRIVRRRVAPYIQADSAALTHAAVTANRQAKRKARLVEDDALFDGKAADDSAAAVPEFIIHETLRELL